MTGRAGVLPDRLLAALRVPTGEGHELARGVVRPEHGDRRRDAAQDQQQQAGKENHPARHLALLPRHAQRITPTPSWFRALIPQQKPEQDKAGSQVNHPAGTHMIRPASC